MTPLNANTILFPPGRLVQGDLYIPQDKDMQGNPLITKSGDNKGKDRVNYYFAVAIPKTRPLWWEESYGAQVLKLAQAAWPQGQTTAPRFSWKIEDGDTHVNEKGRKNSEREGHPGCWIFKFGSGFPTKIFDDQGMPLLEEGVVKLGYWVEVLGSINSNENADKPGIYLNHNMVAFRGRDKEIITGPDPRAVGFGRAALPSHVTMAPVGTANLPATPPAVPGAPYVPATPGLPAVPGAPYVPATPTPPPVAVVPSPGFIAPPVPGAPAAPSAPPPPAAVYADPLGAPPGFRMVAGAGPRYENFKSKDWSDEQMIAAGHMVRL